MHFCHEYLKAQIAVAIIAVSLSFVDYLHTFDFADKVDDSALHHY
jgi:hypothetical protein